MTVTLPRESVQAEVKPRNSGCSAAEAADGAHDRHRRASLGPASPGLASGVSGPLRVLVVASVQRLTAPGSSRGATGPIGAAPPHGQETRRMLPFLNEDFR